MVHTQRIFNYCKRFDCIVPWWLALVLLSIVILRIPTFFEPYWYGDEAIYLTIGNAMNNGARLYAEIVDHKTPLIYYFARVPDQVSFRILLLGWMIMTTVAFAQVARFFFKTEKAAGFATAIFALLTTLPWFEGNIPNGELFVMGFVLLALRALTHTTFIRSFFHGTAQPLSSKDWVWLYGAGCALGLAVLTKVPAVFDAAALGALLLLPLLVTRTKVLPALAQSAQRAIVLGIGVATPIIVSILYFVAIGAGHDYLTYGLLYNFHYTGTWILSFNNPLVAFLYTFPGKASVLLAGFAAVILLRTTLPKAVQFFTVWALCALFASLLSNRPYPHYFMQVVPPIALLVAAVMEYYSANKSARITTTLSAAFLLFLCYGVLTTLAVGLYPVAPYYKHFWKFFTRQQNYTEYRNAFNYLMDNNYAAAKYLAGSKDDKLFIWGTNPTLYALTKKQPVGAFTVSFHIKDLHLYAQTMQAVTAYKPEFIVVMHDETTELPGLDGFLRGNYVVFETYDHFTVWRRSFLSTL